MSANNHKIFITTYAEVENGSPSYFRLYLEGDDVNSIILCNKFGKNVTNDITLEGFHTETFWLKIGDEVSYYKSHTDKQNKKNIFKGRVTRCERPYLTDEPDGYYNLRITDLDGNGFVRSVPESFVELEKRVNPIPISFSLNKDLADWFGGSDNAA